MGADYGQEHFWDPALFNVQITEAIEYPQEYSTAPLDPTFAFESPLIHDLEAVREVSGEPSSRWHGQQGIWATHDSNLHRVESPRSSNPSERPPKMPIEPQPHTKRRTRKPPSGEALERRRQQNRTAQLAFRERSKKQVEELRQELTQCVEFNQKMYSTMGELLERTDSLKRDIEGALAIQPPRTSLESSQPSRTNSLDLFASPTSSNESPDFDYDAAST